MGFLQTIEGTAGIFITAFTDAEKRGLNALLAFKKQAGEDVEEIKNFLSGKGSTAQPPAAIPASTATNAGAAAQPEAPVPAAAPVVLAAPPAGSAKLLVQYFENKGGTPGQPFTGVVTAFAPDYSTANLDVLADGYGGMNWHKNVPRNNPAGNPGAYWDFVS